MHVFLLLSFQFPSPSHQGDGRTGGRDCMGLHCQLMLNHNTKEALGVGGGEGKSRHLAAFKASKQKLPNNMSYQCWIDEFRLLNWKPWLFKPMNLETDWFPILKCRDFSELFDNDSILHYYIFSFILLHLGVVWKSLAEHNSLLNLFRTHIIKWNYYQFLLSFNHLLQAYITDFCHEPLSFILLFMWIKEPSGRVYHCQLLDSVIFTIFLRKG